MNELTEEYTKKLFKYWNKYIREDAPLPETLDVRPIIYESWERSKARKLYPLRGQGRETERN